jgi:serine/threonine protein kinase
VKLLGQGTFGAVYKAKLKTKKNEFAAIKTIKASNPKDRAYVQREIDILGELSHPNIINLKEVIQSAASPDTYLICLQYVEGPSIHTLLQEKGALGFPLARLVARELVAVVSYLHTRAVIHRDLKPDNMLLQGATLTDPDIWDDNIAKTKITSKPWKLMLIDFGLARALSADNIASVELNARNLMRRDSIQRRDRGEGSAVGSLVSFAGKDDIDQKVVDTHSPGTKHHKAQRIRSSVESVGGSTLGGIRTTRMKFRTMSAVGTKAYAAPEIEKGFRKKEGDNDAYDALSLCVADYGMVADSFSVGCVMREILTGVPPNMNVDEYIAMHTPTVVCGCVPIISGSDKNNVGEDHKFRRSAEMPAEANEVISKLLVSDPDKRLTVRELQNSEWISSDVDPFNLIDLPEGDVKSGHHDPIVFLNCAVKEYNAKWLAATDLK